MIAFAAAVVDVGALLNVAWVSLLAGVGIVTLFSFGLLGAARASELRRQGRGAAALVSGALGGLALIAFGVAVIAGVIILVR